MQDNTWKCKNCSVTYTSNKGIRYHLDATNCGFGTLDSSEKKERVDYENLFQRIDNGDFKCVKCERTFTNRKGIYLHIKVKRSV